LKSVTANYVKSIFEESELLAGQDKMRKSSQKLAA
jgi:hypothetical protein